MKKRFPNTRKPQTSGANRVPSFEETLTFVMTNLSHAQDGLKKTFLPAKEKQRFKQMERKPDELKLDDYSDILRRVLKPGLHDVANDSKVHVDVLHRELHEFFKRYEILSWQLVPGRATKQAVLWALAHRFYLPWLALRLAFNLTDDTEVGATPDDYWFIPSRGGRLDSCVMKSSITLSDTKMNLTLTLPDDFMTIFQNRSRIYTPRHLRETSANIPNSRPAHPMRQLNCL